MKLTNEHWVQVGLDWLDLYDRGQVEDAPATPIADKTFLDAHEVCALHERALGKDAKLLEVGALESALARARNAMTYGHATAEQAGWLLAEGIVKNHPFANGNKRTALLALVAFWEKNNVPVPHDAVWLARKILELTKR